MKESRDHKRLIAVWRSRYGKNNGVIGTWFWDRAEFLWKTSEKKRRYDRRWRRNVDQTEDRT